MTLNLIGLGLNENSITVEALKAVQESDEIYLENYTVDFPYKLETLEKSLNVKITPLKRELVEDESVIKKAKAKKISLLIYGDSLSATTHTQLIMACKREKVECKIFHNASILTAIAETGLSLYKFGKTSSMPTWTKSWQPDSFMEYIKQNQSIGAHSLLLVDIALPIEKAIDQLKQAIKNHEMKIDKIVVCKNLGTKNAQIIYDKINNIKDIASPFCFIIPSDLQEFEKEFLESL
jgi:diphthine synthase